MHTLEVSVYLPQTMQDAVVWMGEKGFEVSNHHLPEGLGSGDRPGEPGNVYLLFVREFYADEQFDVVVQWKGKQKRFTANRQDTPYYQIVIDLSDTPSEPGEDDMGTVGITYEYAETRPAALYSFHW